ncbi:MAG TPA: P-loop NTPase, partial [Actinomycetota bacterium]|nr:P-loop NTPase [Actinomycetota bacterium]
MTTAPSILVACGDLILLDEVIRYLEEIPHWKLLKSARSVEELLASSDEPDCVLLTDALAFDLCRHPRGDQLGAGLVVFGRQETMEGLRAAMELGARGFLRWPAERERLRSLVERRPELPLVASAPSAPLHAVWAPKGGAGASVVAAHLAGALATLGKKVVLLDLDLEHADQTAILGPEPDRKSMGDLLRVSDELTSETVRSALWPHPLGFDAVLSPGPG